MSINVGTIDRILRTVFGLVLLWLAFFSGALVFDAALIKYGAAALGFVMLLVSATRICPVYTVFGFKTCRG